MSKSSESSGGIGFVGLLTIVFIVLKLTHVIAWSWWCGKLMHVTPAIDRIAELSGYGRQDDIFRSKSA